MNTRSKRILETIEKSNLSYGELSKLTGIPKSALQRYATGETEKIPIDRIEKIAVATNVSAQYLMGWESKDELFNEKSALLLAEIAKSNDAKRLLSYYLKLSEVGKEKAISYLQDLEKLYSEEE